MAYTWGLRKGKENMTYEKLSRAMRYYKGGQIMDKVANKKFVYRFMADLREICGYSAYELDQRCIEQEQRMKAKAGLP